ncbi:tRNA uridine-5-carboxymethylaminomethyl(34) synthesis GTPase MnmE [Virgibacillus halodenitrificans]|uniref:tRNA uridine-5-carboxymethylaminomethyl(34) synthesis GTPase MnmE n=1 Tax=Virgibacillus halodenitrificans TaxID=1482 RepID=UPI00045CF801|nr:tRNA uridine-5-carboxymethylaminomethyl(34) synthesis GTPase MnmE [Virgibacillus halodenitrificans]MCG1027557.1 tRNA uridine-5-carboxymethylaminomethyl(34) synthesis GTPase MnmE [Virgibacillus halodenitrificans]MCJ0931574.1 tRNA uridine-5-carboxymethylaminomethyl(34) synthesis GTPase MnmE [Virgibacillus halodenitrificans]MEC2157603.1 tRNA uridine-5-carboxymethylaminomethyl(34) synthesis GTPase MnmE [Virgibacillus halodenitrificans]CDQ31966.1 tRNA modification GTPase MnmE [Virgibacillus halod
METDTITAISTPIGEGAIAIVRLSGPEAISITNQLYKGKDLGEVDSHTIHYGKIIDPETEEVAEEVMVSVMRAPKTFTREDVVEINCHGGMVSVNRVLEIVLSKGARLAEPGEFTKRAFLHGRIDLSQAEAVMDLIRAKTDKAMSVALKQMDGRLSGLIQRLRQELLETVAHVEVNIDYPEYDDVEEMSHEMMRQKTKEVNKEIVNLLEVAKQGKILREGLATAIIGRPNVGKSSLMNALVQENKAIVTEIPGTTRDIIEEYVNVRGVPLRLVDTAGIRETEDIVEKIGVERSRQVLKESDLILYVLNYNEALTDEDRKLFEAIQGLEYIVIINKTDLEQKLDLNEVRNLAENNPVVTTSLIEEEGINELEAAIAKTFFAGDIDTGDLTYVSNVRHIQLLKQAKQALEDAVNGLEMGMPLDIVQIDVTRTWEFLGEIIGDTASDSLIDQLFSQFCLGK